MTVMWKWLAISEAWKRLDLWVDTQFELVLYLTKTLDKSLNYFRKDFNLYVLNNTFIDTFMYTCANRVRPSGFLIWNRIDLHYYTMMKLENIMYGKNSQCCLVLHRLIPIYSFPTVRLLLNWILILCHSFIVIGGRFRVFGLGQKPCWSRART